MIELLAAIRPSGQNFPLFVHVLGAMILVGGTLAGASALGFARQSDRMLRLGYFALLLVALPGYIVMRVGAEWIYSRQGWGDVQDRLVPAWIDIGYMVADLGALVFLIALVVGGIGVRRLRSGKGSGLLTATMVLSVILLAAYVVAVWAMSGKPS